MPHPRILWQRSNFNEGPRIFRGPSSPAMINISDKIYIDTSLHQIRKEMFGLLTYKNPEYYQKMNMGLSVWKIPKEVRTYEIKGDQVSVLRGEFAKIRPYLYGIEIKANHPDHKIRLQYINNDFELDQYQQAAVAAITSRNQGVIHAVTSAGKTLIILKSICEIGQKALILVHRKILMKQFLEDIEKYIRDKNGNKIEPGIMGDGKLTIGPITIAIDKTFAKYQDSLKAEFGALYLDECHLCPANTLLSIVNNVNTKHRYGFSGTLRRKDQKEFLIFATFGPVAYKIGEEELLDLNRVVPVQVEVIETRTEVELPEDISPTRAYQIIEEALENDYIRQSIVVDKAAQLPGKTIILSRRVDPCYNMRDMLRMRHNIEAGVITGRDSKEALESYRQMKHEDLKIIFATVGCVSTGVSISDLDNIILIAPIYTNELLLKQIKGRLMRTAEGKQKGTLYFVYDPYVFPESKLRKFNRLINL